MMLKKKKEKRQKHMRNLAPKVVFFAENSENRLNKSN